MEETPGNTKHPATPIDRGKKHRAHATDRLITLARSKLHARWLSEHLRRQIIKKSGYLNELVIIQDNTFHPNDLNSHP